MEKILQAIASEQASVGTSDACVTFVNGISIVGIIESTEGGVVSITRRLGRDSNRNPEYADIPRHFAISTVVGVYYVEGS